MAVIRSPAPRPPQRRKGELHHNAKLSDGQAELVREMYETGFWSYTALARKFEVSRWTIRDIVKYRRRLGDGAE